MKPSILHPRTTTLLLGTLLAASIPCAYAQDPASGIDKVFSWTTPNTPGCACAVSQNGKMVFNKAYGSADLERDAALTTASIFDAGSLQKQFVAASILLLAEEGKLSLADDIRKHISQLPDYGHRLTVDHLLTHTSGIRDWTGLLPLSASKTDAYTMILRQQGLNFIPGEEFSYSNSGYVLLKEIVARVSGMSFGEFTRKRLFEPLGMKSTKYHDDMRVVIKNRALAYDKQGNNWRMGMLLDDDRGGGGLVSTPADLVTWNDALHTRKLSAFVSQKIQENATLGSGRKIGYARGLFIDNNHTGRFWWHTGSADAYKSFLAHYPEKGLSIAIMCNAGEADGRSASAMGRRILELYAPANSQQRPDGNMPPIAAEGVEVSELDLKSREGLFINELTGEQLDLAVDRNRLRIVAGPPLVALSKDHFKRWDSSLQFMSGDVFELRFISSDRLEMKSMEGKATRYRRAKAFSPKPDELKALAGRFGSNEAGTVFLIESKGDGLQIRFEHDPSKSIPLKPIDRDIFQVARMTVRFIRDKNGKVVGFDYSNPLVRKLRFTRLGDPVARR